MQKNLNTHRHTIQIGSKIKIIHLSGEDSAYDGKTGTVTFIDDAGQLHGTWGGLAVIPEVDEFEVCPANNKENLL